MSDRNTRQTNNIAGGSIAGGDINETHIHEASRTSLRELADRIRLEADSDEHLSEFIEQLQRYVASEQGSRDLEQKLADSQRTDLLRDALKLKEQFAKKLYRYQFSPQAQELFTHVLSKIHAYFVHKVRPLVIEKESRSVIDAQVYDDLLCSLHNEVGSCEIAIDIGDLQGMIYFLAGNCHISWD